ncbi:MAG: tetratricopeptide repeat protein [Gemmatimonadetes bacterium]|nr:tetratricopeptide repeat protein [Gemmatimonadota bacterium]
MTKLAFVGVALVALAAPLAAQTDGVSSRVIGGITEKKVTEPACKLDGGHFLVRSGKTYLNSALAATEPANRARLVNDGIRVITEAITQNGQEKSPGAWYWLGRLHMQHGDIVGMDTAYTRALALAPGCQKDIDDQRFRVWATLFTAGNTFKSGNQPDSALVMFRAANRLSQKEPNAFYGMGVIFSQQQQTDSALYYFGKAAATSPTDSNQVKTRNQALFNSGVLQLQAGKAQDAVATFRKYVALEPADIDAKKGLASAYRAAGMADSASAVEAALVNATPGAGATGEVSADDLFDIAVKQFNDKHYADAAATFGRVLAQDPNNRDALYNQANAYLALQDGANLVTAAQKLLVLEPLNENDYSLLIQGQKWVGNTDGVFQAVVAREALTTKVKIDEFKRGAQGVTLTATATGREARDENNKVIAPKALTLAVEFLDQAGNVVTTQEAAVKPLAVGEAQQLTVTGSGQGIRNWRYKVK